MLIKLVEKVLATIKQRGEDNGYDKNPGTAREERSAAQIAEVFNALTGHKLTETDAWTFLQVLKLVRLESQMKNGSGDMLDTCTDLVSYSLLKSETALQEYRPAQAAELVKEWSELVRVHGDPDTQGLRRERDPRTPTPAFKTGDSVVLNSGGPVMRVAGRTMLGDLLCFWEKSEGGFEQQYFAPDTLKLLTGKTSADYLQEEVREIVTGNHPSLTEPVNVAHSTAVSDGN